ncbi:MULTISPECIES: hypothetical protein [Bacillus]|nr:MULTISPECIES: hypothetical protein [Bacillus]
MPRKGFIIYVKEVEFGYIPLESGLLERTFIHFLKGKDFYITLG